MAVYRVSTVDSMVFANVHRECVTHVIRFEQQESVVSTQTTDSGCQSELQLCSIAHAHVASSAQNKTVHLNIESTLTLTQCTFIPRPVYYRVLPEPSDMWDTALEVADNMRYAKNNKPGWHNFNELITGLSLFIESRRE